MSAKHSALKKKTVDAIKMPGVGMGGKYPGGMTFVRNNLAPHGTKYFGKKKTREFHEKQPTSFAKSVRRHAEK